MTRRMILAVPTALALALGSSALAHDPGQGWSGQWGQHGMGQGQGMGPGMMQGMPQGRMMAPDGQPMPGPGMQGRGMMGGHMGGHMMDPDRMGPGMMGQGMMGHGMMGQMGRGQMGPGMMAPGQMGHGMMGPGMMGPGMMGQGMMQDAPGYLREDLGADDVRHIYGHWLERHGNPNLALGPVEETDEDTITLDIVTADGSLVERYEIDRHTGARRPVR